MVESGKCICDKCRLERLRLLEGKQQNALLQIGNLTRKNNCDWWQLEGKLAGGIWWQVILNVESAWCWETCLYRMLELNVQI